jgi:hypothetical protein
MAGAEGEAATTRAGSPRKPALATWVVADALRPARWHRRGSGAEGTPFETQLAGDSPRPPGERQPATSWTRRRKGDPTRQTAWGPRRVRTGLRGHSRRQGLLIGTSSAGLPARAGPPLPAWGSASRLRMRSSSRGPVAEPGDALMVATLDPARVEGLEPRSLAMVLAGEP